MNVIVNSLQIIGQCKPYTKKVGAFFDIFFGPRDIQKNGNKVWFPYFQEIKYVKYDFSNF